MNYVSRRVRESINIIAAASLAAVLGVSMPLTALAQEGIIARENRVEQAQTTRTTSKKAKAAKKAETPKIEDTSKKDDVVKKDEAKPETSAETPAAGSASTGVVAVESRTTATPESTASSVPGAAGAQQDPTQNPITKPLAMSPPISNQRVGVNPDQIQALSLQDSIAMSLQNNLDIESFRQGVQISQYSLFSSEGVFDPTIGANVNYRSATTPVSSIFQGGNTSASVSSNSFVYNFQILKNMEKGGGFYQVDFNNSRVNTSSTAATLTSTYNPSLNFAFTQPLMRDFKIDANRRNIQVAKKQLDLSDSQFRQRVIEIIAQVQNAYWDLYFAIENEKIARQSVDLTLTQLSNNQKQVDAGTLAPIELRSTEAALESRKSDVVVALQGITTAENTLKGLLIKDQNDKMWYSQLTPTDSPSLKPPQFNLEEATTLALKNRQELEQFRLQAQQKEIDLKFYEDQAKPQIDFFGIYNATGLAGTPSTVTRDTTGGFDPTTINLVGSLNEARAGLGLNPFVLPIIPVTTTTLGDAVPERFQGGYWRSLSNLFGQDFRTYQVGVTISFPWKNKIAEANIGRTLAETRQLDARARAQVQSIQIEVRNALQAVESARMRYEAQVANRIAAEAQLRGEVEKFRAGLQSNFFVLQRQTDLAIAQGNEVRAKTDYNKALADLQRATGMTLTINNVQVAPAVTQTNGKK